MSKNPIIIALDFSNEQQVDQFLCKFNNESLFVKVGMELYYSCGNSLLAKLKDHGHDIFLDLKLHDIPNTVKYAMKSLAALDVDVINVHAAGGKQMMEAAVEGLEAGKGSGKQQRTTCIAVTQLTSTNQEMMNRDLRVTGSVEDVVSHYAQLAKASGLDGVVSSPHEVPIVKKACGKSFLTVTPGIRLVGEEKGDQKRVTTPRQAKQLGSNFIVVGRSITQAQDPLAAYNLIKQEWSE